MDQDLTFLLSLFLQAKQTQEVGRLHELLPVRIMDPAFLMSVLMVLTGDDILLSCFRLINQSHTKYLLRLFT